MNASLSKDLQRTYNTLIHVNTRLKIPHSSPSFFLSKDIDVWVTAMVVAFFRKQFAQQKAEWTMVEEKAVNWLKTKDLEEKDVLHEALTFLSS